MKFTDEWKRLIDIGEEEGLTVDQIYLLVTWRELGDETGFGVIAMQGASLEIQARYVSCLIKQEYKRYKEHLLALPAGHFPVTFVRFFVGIDSDSLSEKIVKIQKEIDKGV